jgi:hypothetical protein
MRHPHLSNKLQLIYQISISSNKLSLPSNPSTASRFHSKALSNNPCPYHNLPLSSNTHTTHSTLAQTLNPSKSSSTQAYSTYLISTVLASKYAISPAFLDSRPQLPLSLKPPNGVLMVGIMGPFTKTKPASRLADTRRAQVRSEV